MGSRNLFAAPLFFESILPVLPLLLCRRDSSLKYSYESNG